ncbi:hypothetical protein BRETT_000276 [Brettanomyces bruxellensis]|uniref:Dolichyl-diphosphooligosaccharide-protein glycosyltransferase subunit OST5 n=1 Tax=Dekkera bruxellensis TaxID=5007 RepID=A0A871R5J2_DEKBR|nr:uncharacterized protein BRETT_000276 [Brettanomyces bruxellensis]QOU20566.1 hypothetical protein BRETT_000276 [Brettanomyces bruxellensis]
MKSSNRQDDSYVPLVSSEHTGALSLLFCLVGVLALVACVSLPNSANSKRPLGSAIGSFIQYTFVAAIASLSVGFGELFLASYVGVHT